MLAFTRAASRRASHLRRFVTISDGLNENVDAKQVSKEHEASTRVSDDAAPQQTEDSFMVIGHITKDESGFEVKVIGLTQQIREVKVIGLTEEIRELEAFRKIIDQRIVAAHRQTDKCVTQCKADTDSAADKEKDQQPETNTPGDTVFLLSTWGIFAYMIYWGFWT